MMLHVERSRSVVAWLGVASLGLLSAMSVSAQEPKLQAVLQGHTGAVVAVAFSPDSKTLASASYDGTLKLWDMTTGKERATLGDYKGCLGYVAFSPDGKSLASGAIGSPVAFPDLGYVRLWEVATGKVRTTLEGSFESVAFSPDGKTLAAVRDDGDVNLWDLATNKEQVTLQGHTKEDRETSGPAAGVTSVAFSADGKTLAAAARDMTVKIWEVATSKRTTLQGHTHAVYCVAFSPDMVTLASASGDKTVKLWDLATGKELATLRGHTESVLAVAFSPDGKFLASTSDDKTVKLWDVVTRKERATLKGTETVRFVAFSPNGQLLASAGGTIVNAPGELKVWDIANYEISPIKFRLQRSGIATADAEATYSPDRSVVARVVGEKLKWDVRLFDAARDKPLGSTIELKAHRITALAVSPDNSLVATARGNFSNDWGDVCIWDAKSGKLIIRYTMCVDGSRPALGEVSRLSFSDDGLTVTIVSGPSGGK